MFEFEMRFLLWDAALGAASSQLALQYTKNRIAGQVLQQRAAPISSVLPNKQNANAQRAHVGG